MSSAKKRHEQAMEYAELAMLAQRRGDRAEEKKRLRQAYEHEKEAANIVQADLGAEPTRAILFRSAAAFALDCGKVREAERLVAKGLAGNPPSALAQELRDLYEQINFKHHMELRGVSLAEEELQMSLAGDAVSFGLASAGEVLTRVSRFRTIIYRTAERLMAKPYRERIRSYVKNAFGVYVSVPRPSSYAVTIRVGKPQNQRELFEASTEAVILQEVVSCLQMLNDNSDEKLRDHIKSESMISGSAYYKNFVALARLVAPDGDGIDFVGLTLSHAGREEHLALTRRRSQIHQRDVDEGKGEHVRAVGELKGADETRRKNIIKLENESGNVFKVDVPEGMMSDIVKPLWGEKVQVFGFKRKKTIFMTDIEPVDDLPS